MTGHPLLAFRRNLSIATAAGGRKHYCNLNDGAEPPRCWGVRKSMPGKK